ncbi:hypothetical protein GCM10025780_09060 [Frondihabitans cladoniiphilus]|uniref:Uncharacterized protein n=1 Tax=Frondihabitans cladoniiphilus TaxID=715785 RepID=A0ABP8VPF0_9MICO
MSPMAMQSSPQARHIIIVASSIDIRAFMPTSVDGMGRIIMFIMAWHMSAQLMHIVLPAMPSMAIVPAHIVHACSAAMQASMHACIIVMSMAAIGPSIFSDIMAIIVVVSFIRSYPTSPRPERRKCLIPSVP